MEQKAWMGGTNRIFQWFSSLAYLNLLWVLFTLLGTGLLGIAPSTAALFAVIRQMLREKDAEIPIGKTFVAYCKKDFWKINGIFYLHILIGTILFVDVLILANIDSAIASILLFLVHFIGVFYLITSIYLFPVFVHYRLKWYNYLKQALLLGLIRPIHLLIILAMIVVSYYIIFLVPPLLLFFGISLAVFIIMTVANWIFNELDTLSDNINSSIHFPYNLKFFQNHHVRR